MTRVVRKFTFLLSLTVHILKFTAVADDATVDVEFLQDAIPYSSDVVETISGADPDYSVAEEKISNLSSPLVQAVFPILAKSLPAEKYDTGCESSIYQCDAATQLLSIVRFQNSNGLNEVNENIECNLRQPHDRRIAILLHGFLACTQKWHDVSVQLTIAGFDVVVPLLTGHGVAHSQQPSPLHFVPKDKMSEPVWSVDVGYGIVAKAVHDIVISAVHELGYAEIMLGGFSAGGAVIVDALMLLSANPQFSDSDFKRIRIVHVATFLETPDKVIQVARDFYPLLWLNKLRMKGQWFHIERYSGHPWRLFQHYGRKGYLSLTRSHQMRLLRYITNVRRRFNKLKITSRSEKKRKSAERLLSTPVLAVVLLNDSTIVVDMLLDVLASHHSDENRIICGLKSNHPLTGMCGTCCDEEHCSWFDEYDDRDPVKGTLLHIPDCSNVNPLDAEFHLPQFDPCGGSGKHEEYPDGLNHDTLLDAQSRAGKEPGWWVNCNQNVIVRFGLEERSALFNMNGEDTEKFQCAVQPECSNLMEVKHKPGPERKKKGKWEFNSEEL